MEGTNIPSSTPPVFLSSYAILKCGDVVITRDLQKIVWDSCSCSDMCQYIQKKRLRLQDWFDSVKWSAHETAIKSLTLLTRICTTNFQHNWLYTGAGEKLFNNMETNICPICAKAEEDWQGLPLSNTLRYAIEDQNNLDWDNFMKRCLSTEWGDAKQIHFTTFYTQSKKSTRAGWSKHLMLNIWSCFFQTWATNAVLHHAKDTIESAGLEEIWHTFIHYQHSLAEIDTLLFVLPLER
eukprot:7191806-Ditylum_brightwellii.AAC.1